MPADDFRKPAQDDLRTSTTLLAKIRDLTNDQAWRRFFADYEPLVVKWCLRQGLQQSDADEVACAVMEKLARKMPTFRYDPAKSFRAWLKTLVSRAVVDFWRQMAVPGARGNGGSAQFELMQEVAASETAMADLTQRLGSSVEEQLRRVLEVCAGIQERVEPQVWQSFWLTAANDLKPADVARRIGIKVTSVYVYKHRVLKMLRQELMPLK